MRKYRRIKKDLGGICRECLNKKYDLSLERKDCNYAHFPYVCDNCRNVKNIVCDINLLKKFLL